MEKKIIREGVRDMKKSPSEQALAELFGGKNGGDISSADLHQHPSLLLINQDVMHGRLSSFNNPLSDHLNFWWSKKTTPTHASCIVGPGDAHSSTCDITKNTGATSGSSHDELWEDMDDDMDAEEGGACEQSMVNNNDVKRKKRMASNRESARRSRRRKQEQLAELENQADQLRGENASLFKQLADAAQQYKDSSTNNRVLKSDVEALRAKVKLAEDMVGRGSVNSSLTHLIQNYLTAPAPLSNNNVCRLDNMSAPSTMISVVPELELELEGRHDYSSSVLQRVTIQGPTSTSTSTMELQNNNNNNNNNGVISEVVSCVSDIWS